MEIPKRACPECGCPNYSFRNRKQIEATAEKGPELETKYRCRDCENEWKERVPGVLKKAPPPEQDGRRVCKHSGA